MSLPTLCPDESFCSRRCSYPLSLLNTQQSFLGKCKISILPCPHGARADPSPFRCIGQAAIGRQALSRRARPVQRQRCGLQTPRGRACCQLT